jgi:DNA replication and repair protein RecF
MRLAHLSLTSFRNYESLELALDPGHHLFLGGNGEGKTNILEAIHLLGTGSSQRASRDQPMIRHGERGFRVGARLEPDTPGHALRVEVIVDEGEPKRVLLDREPARASDLLAAIKVVSFAPSDVELVQEGARSRRKFLDLIGCQLSPEYLQLLREYQRALKQRNETLLRSFMSARGRDGAARAREPWDDLVVQLGSELLMRRRELIEQLAETIAVITRDAFGGAGPVGASYQPGVRWDGDDPKPAFAATLARTVTKDEAVGYTTAGPHTDDMLLELGGRELRRFGSLGQQQLSAMFLKLSQADLVRTAMGAPPLLLVDEMFAILDRRAAEEFLARVEGEGQIFLATAQEGWLGELRERRFHVHQVRTGTVRSEMTETSALPPDASG